MGFIFLLLLLAAQDQPPQDASISGTVTDAVTGTPLSKVEVLVEVADGPEPPASTVTDEKGNFALIHIRTGEYRLKGVRNGYLETYYGARRAGNPGILLDLGPGAEQNGLALKLIPFAVIAGTVRDPEGEPLAEAHVALIGVSYRNNIRKLRASGQYATTDDLGQYRIPAVRPGQYYVRAGPEQSEDARHAKDHSAKPVAAETLTPTFYPAARDFSGARKIDVAAGEHFTGADVTLLRSRLYRVRVKLEGPPGIPSGVSLSPWPDLSDGLGPHPASDCNQAHVCEFTHVPSGSYAAVAQTSPATPRSMTLDDLFSHSVQTWVTVPVDVNNADVDDLLVSIAAPAEIAGQITIPGEDSAAIRSVAVAFVDNEGAEHDGRFSKDGAFTARLSQGRYEVQVHAGGDLVPASIRSEQIDVLADGLAISRSGKVPLEITLSHDGAAVDGTVQDSGDKPVAGATVVLIPEAKLRFRHDLYQQTSTDQFGRYHFKSVAPANYKVFVWPDVQDDIWFDPEFLKSAESLGQALTVTAKTRASANLHLPAEKQ